MLFTYPTLQNDGLIKSINFKLLCNGVHLPLAVRQYHVAPCTTFLQSSDSAENSVCLDSGSPFCTEVEKTLFLFCRAVHAHRCKTLYLEDLQTTATNQQFREKTRTLTQSALAMLKSQWVCGGDDGVSDQE